MEDDQASFVELIVFPALIALLAIGWLAIGPGWQLLMESSVAAKTWLDTFAIWYQQKLEGSAKLVAPVITIASGSYAIVKSYKFAESRLQYRLQDFLDREEKRLKGAREQLRLSIERPGRERPFRSPIFLAPSLKRVVSELGWGSYFLPPQLAYADFQIGSSIDQLQKQVKLSSDRQSHLNLQLATAHLLKGAMLAAEATRLERANKESRGTLTASLNQFNEALAVYPNDVEALEYASHMHVRLGDDDEAEKLLDRLLALTSGQTKSLPRARALRYKGGIAARRGNPIVAVNILQDAIGALPVQIGVDRLEEAEMYETLANCQLDGSRHIQAAESLRNAKAIFAEVRESTPKEPTWKSWFSGNKDHSAD